MKCNLCESEHNILTYLDTGKKYSNIYLCKNCIKSIAKLIVNMIR